MVDAHNTQPCIGGSAREGTAINLVTSCDIRHSDESARLPRVSNDKERPRSGQRGKIINFISPPNRRTGTRKREGGERGRGHVVTPSGIYTETGA